MIKNLIIPAGQTIPVTGNIKRFYLVQSPVALNIRAGDEPFSTYVQQTGELNVPDGTTLLEVQNPSAISVVCQIFFDSVRTFWDRRLLPSPEQPNVPLVTVAQGASASVPDRSGTVITDSNGNQWYAVQRTALLMSNGTTDTSGGTPANAFLTFAGQGNPTFTLPGGFEWNTNFAGGFTLSPTLAATLFVQVFETYQAIPLTLPSA